MDQEAHAGTDHYAPDYKARLYPPRLSEDVGNLLPGQIRPARPDMDVGKTEEGMKSPWAERSCAAGRSWTTRVPSGPLTTARR